MKTIKLLTLVAALSLNLSVTADESLWQDVAPADKKSKEIVTGISQISSTDSGTIEAHHNARTLKLDEASMGNALKQPQLISLPLPSGGMIKVTIETDNILPAELASKYPSIQSYRVLPNQQLISGRLDMTSKGFHGMLQLRNGETVFIDPSVMSDTYVAYNKHEQHQDKSYSCGVDHAGATNPVMSGFDVQNNLSDNSLAGIKEKLNTTTSIINYRIAIAATGEYVEKSGGTVASALAAISTTLARVNQVYERDLGIHLTLVENNDLIIYTNAESDPYDAKDPVALINQNQVNTDQVIGSDNYDIGHLFTTNSGGGVAAIASLCNDSRKALGVSGITNPFNDSFNIDFVAHEIGHQLGATHTFNSTEGSCSGTRTKFSSFEPGSGSSVMAYAGSCGVDNLQSNSDAMFHIGSIEQIRSNTQQGLGRSCGVRSRKDNQAPIADAGTDYTIPARTPFELIGNAQDSDNDNLVYGWQQMDAGSDSRDGEDKGDNALFRAYVLNDNATRTFPNLDSLLPHVEIKGETLPTQTRELNFKFVVQDGFNSARSDAMKINVKRTGSRFAIEKPRAYYALGKTHTIKWNVANTDKAPINCANVDVLLSVDGGYSFPHRLADNVPNTGNTSVLLETTLPEVYQARFKVKCSNNIFFAISNKNIKLTLDNVSDAPEAGPEDNLLDTSVNQKSQKKKSAGSTDFLLFALMLVGLLVRKQAKTMVQ
jgi:hypothetical protein